MERQKNGRIDAWMYGGIEKTNLPILQSSNLPVRPDRLGIETLYYCILPVVS